MRQLPSVIRTALNRRCHTLSQEAYASYRLHLKAWAETELEAGATSDQVLAGIASFAVGDTLTAGK